MLAPLTAVANGAASEILAPSAVFLAPMAADAEPESHLRLQRAAPAEEHAVPGQYHGGTDAISAQIAFSIADWNCCSIVPQISRKSVAVGSQDRPTKEKQAQYQPAPPQYQGDRLMLRIGVLLGLAYVAFLAIWIWATRFRPH